MAGFYQDWVCGVPRCLGALRSAGEKAIAEQWATRRRSEEVEDLG